MYPERGVLKKMVTKSNQQPSDIVKLGGSIGGLMIATIIVFLIFASEHIELLVPLVWAFVVLAIVLGFYQYKAIATSTKEKKR